ncbi:MAG TPA: fructosamine kinase family protein [Trebonia sp.]|jgi:fructosamine-3-kinase|nr:fructosamine kinase family protein [Trebonia sp.]
MPEQTPPQHTLPDDTLLRAELRLAGHDGDIASVRRLDGGFAAGAWLVSFADGTRVAGKTLADAPDDLFAAEAAGLAALRATGLIRTPDVLAVTARLLLLGELPVRDDSESAWEEFAVSLASMHQATVHERFGWNVNGYLGLFVQENDWTADGHEFFAEHRLLRYLREPLVDRALTAADRRALEAFCDRLPDIIPPMPAVLTHGDLWCGNVLGHPAGGLSVIDPAVSYTWAEVDLSMLRCCPRPPASDRFFDVYQEVNPSPPGWAERMPLLHLRELLSIIASETDQARAVQRARDTLAPFYRP